MLKVKINGVMSECEEGTSLLALAERCGGDELVLATVNGRLSELQHAARDGDEISFVSRTDPVGYDTWRRSCSMLFFTAVHLLYGEKAGQVVLHFALGNGFYFTFGKKLQANEDTAAAIRKKMEELVERKIPFEKTSIPTRYAIDHFAKIGMPDKAKLFRTRIASTVNIYSLEGYEDYYYGYMVHNTGQLDHFRVEPYKKGMLLLMPSREDPDTVAPFSSSEKLFKAQILGEEWAEAQMIGNVADLNEIVIGERTRDMILVSEAFQEASIADMAGKIRRKGKVRFVMIAGPSSSGKTTFSQRLSVQLRVQGLKPHYIGVDNYFINREEIPADPDGKRDFESIDAVDVKQFKEDMAALLEGKTVPMPTYDFLTGKRVYLGNTITLGDDDILIIEGIHCLNDYLSDTLPDSSKFRIYISALTQLNIDMHNRIPTNDGRLIRRIVRDNRTRGYSASQTISMWGSVRSGEERNIFPFQEKADVFFNSALPYEIAALKTYAQPLLFKVTPEDPAYQEARRLLKFLDYFVAIPAEEIPANSLLREFIGGGCFHL